MTKTCLLDYDSIAGADKFGNIFVLRVPLDVSDDVDNPTGVNMLIRTICKVVNGIDYPPRCCRCTSLP